MALPMDASAYEDSHEHQHAAQAVRNGVIWRAFVLLRPTPLGLLALLAVEAQAAGMALAELRRCGILRAGDVAEAAWGLRSYGRALVAK